jgi:hypothetical protein
MITTKDQVSVLRKILNHQPLDDTEVEIIEDIIKTLLCYTGSSRTGMVVQMSKEDYIDFLDFKQFKST